jgi:hypothetical protein
MLLEPAHLDLHCRRRSCSDDRPNHIEYRIIEKLGAGGTGVCYRSESWAAPLPREVFFPEQVASDSLHAGAVSL